MIAGTEGEERTGPKANIPKANIPKANVSKANVSKANIPWAADIHAAARIDVDGTASPGVSPRPAPKALLGGRSFEP